MTLASELPPPEAAIGSLRPAARSALRWQGMAAMVGLSVQLVQLAWLARALPPESFGAMGAASLFLWFGQGLCDLGLGLALLQAKQVTRDMQLAAYGLTLAASLFIALGMYSLSTALGSDFFASPQWPALVLGLLPCFPLMAISAVAQAGLQRELRFKVLGLAEAAAALAGFSGAALGLHFFGDARALVLAQVSNTATRTVLYALRSPWRFGLSLRASALRPLYPFGAYQLAERMLGFFVGHLDKLVLGRLLGGLALGLYTVAYQLALRPLSLFAPLVQRTASPIFSRLQGETLRLHAALLLSTRLMAAIAAPVHLLGAALATPLLRLMLGPQWEGVVPIFQALCLWGFITTAGQPAGSLLPAVGRADSSLKLNVAAVLTYALVAYAGSFFGPAGIAWGMVFGVTLVLVPYDAYLRRQATGLGLFAWARAILPALAISSASGLVAVTVSRLIPGSGGKTLSPWDALPFAEITPRHAAWSLGLGLLAGLALEALLQWIFTRAVWREARSLVFYKPIEKGD